MAVTNRDAPYTDADGTFRLDWIFQRQIRTLGEKGYRLAELAVDFLNNATSGRVTIRGELSRKKYPGGPIVNPFPINIVEGDLHGSFYIQKTKTGFVVLSTEEHALFQFRYGGTKVMHDRTARERLAEYLKDQRKQLRKL